MICLIENKAYELEKEIIEAILKMAKEKYINEHKHAVYAVKDKETKMFDLKRQEAKTEKQLLEIVEEYKKNNFEVYYI